MFTPTGELPPPRTWCGGPDFPKLVDERVLPLLPDGGRRADSGARRVAAMLAVEQGIEARPVHGDLGMHNIFWEDDGCGGEHPHMSRISGVIDLDHACLGDPAIDVALIGQFGAEALADAVAPDTLQRALAHRATLSLQVAVAAELVGDATLRDFALANFSKRLVAGTLYDPDGARPDS